MCHATAMAAVGHIMVTPLTNTVTTRTSIRAARNPLRLKHHQQLKLAIVEGIFFQFFVSNSDGNPNAKPNPKPD